ncbi:uncharacterized protein LOC130982308 isoform X1 [Arachis stenosperma]|uniref:uncharacterized protein LOC130982308 isoform X1 n=1 Tax=Arachis stenosperma TaxID=217475 RepID=UPI0025ACFC25|nr:uncharacterized protein LOC130982308 isoform X1 [Arachis stenosperma]
MEPEPPSQVLLLDKLLLLVKLFLLEKPVAIWSFNTMLYSSNEELRNSSSDFWCAVLSSRKEFDASSSENMGESGLPPVSLPNESTSIRSPSAFFSDGSVLNDLNFSCLFIAGSVLDLNFS